VFIYVRILIYEVAKEEDLNFSLLLPLPK
jgi:hypothetical protein